MNIDLSTLPQQVRDFVQAVRNNALQVPEWDEQFVLTLLHIHPDMDGGWEVSDNYERFFGGVYTYTYGGKWLYRSMYSEQGDRPYQYVQVMADASIIYTG